jgi:hypothetical protein
MGSPMNLKSENWTKPSTSIYLKFPSSKKGTLVDKKDNSVFEVIDEEEEKKED